VEALETQEKEAYLYSKQKAHKVKCNLCSHRCLISEGKRGICMVRENREGRLYSLVYERPVSMNIDPIEKKPLYHFLPGSRVFSFGTSGCNFRCSFCQNWEISQASKEGKELGDRTPVSNLANFALKNKCQAIAYTYSEPTIFFELAYDTAKIAKEKQLKNVFVTNGYYTPEAIKKISPYLDAANIDLKSFSDGFYKRVCGARLEPVLEAIKLTKNMGIWTELTTLLIPGENDSVEELKQIALFIASLGKEIPWHISRFTPLYEMKGKEATPIKSMIKAYELGKEAGLKNVYLGNVMEKIYNSTYCSQCGKMVIEREGYKIYNLLNGNKCKHCGTAVAGVFDAK